MKGEALITIKTKDGKIKQQVKEKNVVFDIPKDILKETLKYIDVMRGVITTSQDQQSVSWGAASAITDFKAWFQAIRVYEENVSTTDKKDVKKAVLIGGKRNITGYSNYAQVTDNTNSMEDPNVLKFSYTWNNCPAFYLKAISLCNWHNFENGTYEKFNLYGGAIRKLKNMMWCDKTNLSFARWLGNVEQYGNSYTFEANSLFKIKDNAKFKWVQQVKDLEQVSKPVGNTTISYSGSYPCIFAAANDEIIVISEQQDITQTRSGHDYFNYLHVVDATTGQVKRTYPRAKFGVSSGSYLNSYAVITTDFGNFLYLRAAKKIYTIPDNQSDDPELFADLSSDPNITYASYTYGYQVINNFIVEGQAGTGYHPYTIVINSATPGDVTTYGYGPIAGIPQTYGQAVNKYYENLYKGGSTYEWWYNATALNLSGNGVQVTAGDTITIEYTITAN